MILDSLKNIDRYRFIGPRFVTCLDALKAGIGQRADGRYELDSTNVFAIVQRYPTKPHDQGRWEAHRKYVDLQVMIRGGEYMGWTPLENCKSIVAYDAEKDVEFFEAAGQSILVPEAHFTVFFQHDVHKPTLMINSPAEVLKVVFKIAI